MRPPNEGAAAAANKLDYATCPSNRTARRIDRQAVRDDSRLTSSRSLLQLLLGPLSGPIISIPQGRSDLTNGRDRDDELVAQLRHLLADIAQDPENAAQKEHGCRGPPDVLHVDASVLPLDATG